MVADLAMLLNRMPEIFGGILAVAASPFLSSN